MNKTYYSTWDTTMDFSKWLDIEVDERGNYTNEEILKWINKYNLHQKSQVVWVYTNKYDANSYNLLAEDYKKRYNINDEEIDVVEWTKGFIIPESNDGANGFLFILKN